MVDSGKKFASIAEINTGQGNPNAPVGTTMALLERSTKVLSAIHKRMHNAQRKEFKLLASIFQEYLPPEYPYVIGNKPAEIKLEDFNEQVDIIPVSNPDIFSTSQRIAMAQEMMQLVQSNPEIHGPNGMYESYKRMYAAIGVDNTEQILMPPPSLEPMPIEAGMENNSLLMGQPAQAFMQQNHDAHIAIHMSLLKTPPVQMNAQVQALIHAHIMQHLQMKADGIALQQMPQDAKAQYDQLNAQIEQADPATVNQIISQANSILAQFSSPILAELINEYVQQVEAPQDEDPLVSIRKQELALKGQQLNQDQEQFKIDQKRKSKEAMVKSQIDLDRIEAQEDIAKMKDDTTQDRMDQQKELKLLDLANKNSS